ncbi:MAG: NAD(P)H-dependent oxidoreductase [Rhizobiaceae bacterium]|nr:NAD(P)H-dependent oxidoreductase [Rhizobiaceae bacterium]
MALRLNIITVSTRPGRIGPHVANWFHEAAREHGKFEAVPVDLAEFDLPIFDEPKHPRLAQYEHAHTKNWSESVASGDAFVFVTPEYDYFTPPSLVNAIIYLSKEWAYKPAGIVSYGGVSGGLRGAQTTRLLLTTKKVMPIPEGVPVPLVSQHIAEDKIFRPTEPVAAGAVTMLDELHRWAKALGPMRA